MNNSERQFLKLLDARHVRDAEPGKTALFLDPDTGITKHATKKHTTIRHISEQLELHELVFVFDQSFSRGRPVVPQLEAKLRELARLHVHAFFYDSHAHFLFASRSPGTLAALRAALIDVGLPDREADQRATQGRDLRGGARRVRGGDFAFQAVAQNLAAGT
jgi:hypothetical protein